MYGFLENRPWSSEKRDIEFGRCIGMYVVLNELNSVLQNVFGFSGSLLKYSKLVIGIICFGIIARCLFHLKRKELGKFLLTEIGMLALYGYSLLIGVEIGKIVDWSVISLGICIPLAIFAYATKDKSILIHQLYLFSWAVLLLLLADTLGKENKRYDIHFSQIFMFVIILHLNQFFKTKKVFILIVAIVEMVIVLIYGSRGPLVAILVYICIRLLLNDNSITRKVAYISVAVLITIGVFYLVDSYGYSLLKFFQGFGFDSRSLRLILEGRFTSHDSGRSLVWENSMRLINEQPIIGWGINGASSRLGHPYPHNYFLDFWLSFGYFLGTVLLICSLVPMRKLFSLKMDSVHECIYIFFASSMVVLMISGTWFTNFLYFIYMGLLLSETEMKHRTNLSFHSKFIK